MQTFKKEERLSSQKLIKKLFEKGNSFKTPPFRVVWIEEAQSLQYPASVLIAIQRKHIKKAVDRNLVKRRIREAYRKNKNTWYTFLSRNKLSCSLAIIYLSGEIAPYEEIEKKIIYILQRLQEEYEKIDR